MTTEIVSRHKNEVATQNPIKGRTAWSGQENEVATQKSAREEKAKSRHIIEVATQNPLKGKTFRSLQESVVATQTLGD